MGENGGKEAIADGAGEALLHAPGLVSRGGKNVIDSSRQNLLLFSG